VAARNVEYSPARHLMHTTFPVTFLYLPGTHSVHLLESDPENPGLHAQSCVVRLASGEDELDGHKSHCVFPISALYVSTGHGLHRPLSNPMNPSLQLQCANPLMPVLEFGGHSRHTFNVAPKAMEY